MAFPSFLRALNSRNYRLFFAGQGMFPVGSLIVGSLAEMIGARFAMAACALVTLATAAIYARNPPSPGPSNESGKMCV